MARHTVRLANALPTAALLLLMSVSPASAQNTAVRQYVREHQPAILREFLQLVAIPSVRTDLPNIRRNAEQLEITSGLNAGERVITSDYTGYDRIDRIVFTD